MKETDKRDVVQSYMITTAHYGFSLTEKKIMYRLVEASQDLIEGRQLRGRISIQENLLRDREVSMSYQDILNDEENRNITTVRKALLDLLSKKVIWRNEDGGMEACTLIERPKWHEARGTFNFRVPMPIWEAMMLQFSKGFRKYQLSVAMSLRSVYSMRLYEIVSGQKKPLYYKVDDLKGMLGISNKYPRLYDLKKWVLEVAKQELDAVGDYSFDYVVKGGVITFLPYPLRRGDRGEFSRLKRDIRTNWVLPQEVIDYLKVKGFTDKEIKANLELFQRANNELDIMIVLAELFGKSRTKSNPKGYVINGIKGKLSDKNALE